MGLNSGVSTLFQILLRISIVMNLNLSEEHPYEVLRPWFLFNDQILNYNLILLNVITIHRLYYFFISTFTSSATIAPRDGKPSPSGEGWVR